MGAAAHADRGRAAGGCRSAPRSRLLDPRDAAAAGDSGEPTGDDRSCSCPTPPAAPGAACCGRSRGRDAVVGPGAAVDAAGRSVPAGRAARALLGGRGARRHRGSTCRRSSLTADPEALADLRARALAPLADLRPATAERLAETLRSWLLHQGRRDDVAADLFVHPQTVRYRMAQLRELYGDRLKDPARCSSWSSPSPIRFRLRLTRSSARPGVSEATPSSGGLRTYTL